MVEDTKSGQNWYGATWLEFFISFILARGLQYVFFPDIGLVILLPVLWLAVHVIFGRMFSKAENFVIPGLNRLDDIFGRK